MEKPVLRQRLGWLASFCWMIVIFLFSAQDGTESSRTSELVMDTLHSLLASFLPEGTNTSAAAGFGMFLLRKGAHFFVFTVLGFLLCTTVCQYPAATSLQKTALPLSLGILYACVDELHQYFVPGRACQIRDVCIDTCGVLLGVFLSLGLMRLLRRSRRKKKEKAAGQETPATV